MSKVSPKVSVVVTNYNHGRFLAQRLDTVLGQTFQDFEVLYLDDCSSDDSAAVFAAYAQHPRVRAVVNETNSGSPYKQANKGLGLARGEYVWFAEADDYADPDFLATLVPLLDAHPEAGLAYCQSVAVDESGKALHSLDRHTRFLDPDHWRTDFVARGRDEVRRFLIYKNTIPNLSAVLVRAEVLRSVGGFEEGLRLSGDQLTWIRLLLRSDLAFVARPMNFFRQHQRSVRTKSGFGRAIREHYRILDEVRGALNLPPEQLEQVHEQLLKSWLKKLGRAEEGIAWGEVRSIVRQARRSDSMLGSRLMRRVFGRMVRLRLPWGA